MDIFILAGQSNMTGRGDASELPEFLQKIQMDVQYYYYCGFGADESPPKESFGWVLLGPCEKHDSTPGPHFGPEITFGRMVADRWKDREVGIIKVAIGATSLSKDWAPDARSGRLLYRFLVRKVREALSELTDRGEVVRLGGMIWMQGESDATNRLSAESYKKHLEDFILRIREDFRVPQLPFIIGQIVDRTNPQMVYADLVRKAQQEVATVVSWVERVSTDDLADCGDGTHFDSKAYQELGQRFAESVLKLIDRQNISV